MCDQECLSNSNSIVFPAEINLFNAESNHPLRLHRGIGFVDVCARVCAGGAGVLLCCVCVCVCVCVRQRPPVRWREPVNLEPECALSIGI